MNSDERKRLLGDWEKLLEQNFKLFGDVRGLVAMSEEMARSNRDLRRFIRDIASGRMSQLSDKKFLDAEDKIYELSLFTGVRSHLLETMRFILSESNDSLGVVADVGCGSGVISMFLKQQGLAQQVICTEATQRRVQCVREFAKKIGSGVDIRKGLMNSLPIIDASIDTLLVIDAMEWSRDRVSGLLEFARILKPEGKLIMTIVDHGYRGIVDVRATVQCLLDAGVLCTTSGICQGKGGRVTLTGVKVL